MTLQMCMKFECAYRGETVRCFLPHKGLDLVEKSRLVYALDLVEDTLRGEEGVIGGDR